jgi:phospholipase/lecithinase/hemolysin
MLKFPRKLCLILGALSFSLLSANAQKFSAIVTFGDSLSDLGNTYSTLGDWGAYGLADYNSYFYDQGRWSNGPLWIEDIGLKFGFAALQRNDGSNLYGTDFAWGGSTSFTGFTFAVLPNLQQQVAYYINLLSTKYARMPKPADALFTVWSGGNDVIYNVTHPDLYPLKPQEVTDNIGKAIASLYKAGGRIFLVPNLPPLGDKPNFRNTKYQDPANDFVVAYNPLLQSKLAGLRQTQPGVTILEFDVYALFQDVLNDPAKYGLTNVRDTAYIADILYWHGGYLVDDVDKYLFWDGTHPTRVGHGIVGEGAYKVIANALGLSSVQPQP